MLSLNKFCGRFSGNKEHMIERKQAVSGLFSLLFVFAVM